MMLAKDKRDKSSQNPATYGPSPYLTHNGGNYGQGMGSWTW